MRFILCSLLLLLFTLPVSADPLATLDSFVTTVKAQCLIPTAGNEVISSSFIQGVVRRKLYDMSYEYNIVEQTDTIIGSSDSTAYTLNSDFLRLYSVMKFTGDTLLIPLQYEVVDSTYAKHKLEALLPDYFDPAKPRFAWSFDKRLFLIPMAQYEDEFIVTYFALAPQPASLTDTIRIPEEYREALLHLVCAEIQLVRRDYVSADKFLERYALKMKPLKSREEEGKK